jgi:hypothetical protein
MADLRDINYYKVQAKGLSRKRFEQLCLKGKVEFDDYGTQLTVVAALLQHQARLKLEAATKNINFVPPPDVKEYLFNDLNFVLWSMPQENPIPTKIYKKLMQIKELNSVCAPVPDSLRITDEEAGILQNRLVWKRGNEKFGVEIIGSIRSGIPFGQDRLVLIWIITQALRTGEPTVLGFKVKEFLDYFGLDTNGDAYDEVHNRFNRLKEANIRVWWTAENKRFELQCNYLDNVIIVRPKKSTGDDQDINLISLSLSLWAHLAKENYVWLNPDVVRELKSSPGALDLYQWACVYIFKKKLKVIPLTELFHQLGMKEEQLFKHKKLSIKRWINLINKTVNKGSIVGPGIQFKLELKEGLRGKRSDLVTVQPSTLQNPADRKLQKISDQKDR